MLSKRDKLLVRPWQQRKYENHRRKVQSALPVIDNKPPATREHVLYKLKKHQKEIERCTKIERDNLTLLRKLSHTMRTSRVDNYWNTPQPNFLNRVPLYNYSSPTREEDIIIIEADGTEEVREQRQEQKQGQGQILELEDEKNNNNNNNTKRPSTRKERCSACTPKKIIDILVPEERIPWEPEKQPISSRLRSKSVPVRKPQTQIVIQNQRQIQTKSGGIFTKSKSVEAEEKEGGRPKRTSTAASSSSHHSQHSSLHSHSCVKLSKNGTKSASKTRMGKRCIKHNSDKNRNRNNNNRQKIYQEIYEYFFNQKYTKNIVDVWTWSC